MCKKRNTRGLFEDRSNEALRITLRIVSFLANTVLTTWTTPHLRLASLVAVAASSLAESLDLAKADSTTGMRKHAEVIYNCDVVLHAPVKSVFKAIMGNSVKSGIGDLRQKVVQQGEER